MDASAESWGMSSAHSVRAVPWPTVTSSPLVWNWAKVAFRPSDRPSGVPGSFDAPAVMIVVSFTSTRAGRRVASRTSAMSGLRLRQVHEVEQLLADGHEGVRELRLVHEPLDLPPAHARWVRR